jgi:hypothetical protein
VRLIGAVLANILIWDQTVLYPVYKATDAVRGINPASDQSLAGGLMMVSEMILTTLLLGWLFFRFARQDEERQSLLDFAYERGFDLSEERAARAARAGRGEALRERILAATGGGNGVHVAPALNGQIPGNGDGAGEMSGDRANGVAGDRANGDAADRANGDENLNHAKEIDGQLAGPNSSG